VKSAIPLPSVKSGKLVVPTNSPANEPVNDPVASAPVKVKPATVAAEAPNATEVEPIVTLLFDNCEFVTFASAPPNVSVGSTVSPSEVNVIPFTFPVADTV